MNPTIQQNQKTRSSIVTLKFLLEIIIIKFLVKNIQFSHFTLSNFHLLLSLGKVKDDHYLNYHYLIIIKLTTCLSHCNNLLRRSDRHTCRISSKCNLRSKIDTFEDLTKKVKKLNIRISLIPWPDLKFPGFPWPFSLT